MRDVVPAGRRAWCTIDSADVRSLLRDERVTLALGPTCRNLRNLVGNLRIAWRVLRQDRPRMIVATGSGVAVPFAWIGRLLGIPVFYVECGGRVDRPSLSCRLISPVAHRSYVQSPELAVRVQRARFHGRLPWRAVNPQTPLRDGSTLITVGTSRIYAFDRLVETAQHVAGRLVVQRGVSSTCPEHATVVDFMSFDELSAAMATADRVVTHGGIGSVLLAVMHGHTPIVMARRQDLGEGVDDHQVHFARQLEREGLAIVIDTTEDVEAALQARPPSPTSAPDGQLLARLELDVRRVLAGT